MTSVAFDTLRFATALRDKAKLSQEQAEGFAFAMSEALQDGLVMKSDLEATEARLENRIEASEARLRHQIEANKADILKWMFGTIGFQTLVVLGATAGLIRLAHP